MTTPSLRRARTVSARTLVLTFPLLAVGLTLETSALTPTHRYSFTTDGTDAVGDADATLLGNARVEGGQLILPGGGARTNYASLPDTVGFDINGYEAVTFEVWFTTTAVQNWSKLFYFGEPSGGAAVESLEFTPVKGDGSGLGKAESLNDNVASAHHTTLTYSETGAEIHLVVVFDAANGLISVYKNGELDGESGLTHFLSDVSLPFLYLGAAVGWGDADYNGRINEFRIYDVAFAQENVTASFASGPDELPEDADGDGMPDSWEAQHGVDDPAGDPDGDGLSNLQEYQRGTNPNLADTDGDGLNDRIETGTGVWVSATDTGTHPLRPDTDHDGLPDGVETNTGTFVDATHTGTNPLLRDTDGDGSGDGAEVASGSNPTQASSVPVPRLAQRYSFAETTGRTVADSVSGAAGRVHGEGFTWGDGAITLDGGSPNSQAYVALPAGLLSNHGLAKGGRGAVTLEGWATVLDNTGGAWARLVDFGSSEPGGANGGVFAPGNTNGGGTAARDTFWLSAYNNLDTAARHVSIRNTDGITYPPVELPVTPLGAPGEPLHFAITFDESSGVLRYYENGELVDSRETDPANPIKLSNLNDVNNWLGRSNYTTDGILHGRYDEIRLYDGALSEAIIAQHFNDGPSGTPGAAAATDTDGDGLPDWFERAYGLNPNDPADAALDADTDGLTNLQEFQRGSSPLKADTDGDGLPDAAETNTGIFASASNAGSSPVAYDSDSDGLGDWTEVQIGADPVTPNTTAVPLLHRWSFNEPANEAVDPDTAVLDAVTGEANAFIRGNDARFTGTGVSLPGGASDYAAYVDLPNNLISPLSRVTLETWVTIDAAGNNWARILDFGNTLDPDNPGAGRELNEPGGSGNGGDYLLLIGAVGADYNTNRLELREATPGPVITTEVNFGIGALAEGEPIHYVVVVDSTPEGLSRGTVWRNGVVTVANVPLTGNLSQIDDVNNWLGRSNWLGDANLAGTYDEFRLYNGLLSAEQIRASYAAGPDAVIGGPPPAAGFEITSVSAPAGSPLTLTFPTETGQTYQVETSTTLATSGEGAWTTLGSPLAGTGNPATFTDTVNGPPSTTGGLRFYRVRVTTP